MFIVFGYRKNIKWIYDKFLVRSLGIFIYVNNLLLEFLWVRESSEWRFVERVRDLIYLYILIVIYELWNMLWEL